MRRFLYCVFLCLWTAFCIIATQFIVAFPLAWIVGPDVTTPVWTTIYNAIVYILALTFIIFLPLLIAKKLPKYNIFDFAKWQKSPPSNNTSPLKDVEKNTAKTAQKPLKTSSKSTGNEIEFPNVEHTLREKLGLRDLPTFTDIGLAIVAFLVYLLLASIVVNILSNFPWFDANQAQNVGYNNLGSIPDQVIAFVALALIAPIAEEIIFRGWLYDKLRSTIPLVPALILVSVVFGALHGQWNVAVNVGIMSAVLCAEREITGTIYSGIILHIIKNAIAFYLLYILHAG